MVLVAQKQRGRDDSGDSDAARRKSFLFCSTARDEKEKKERKKESEADASAPMVYSNIRGGSRGGETGERETSAKRESEGEKKTARREEKSADS